MASNNRQLIITLDGQPLDVAEDTPISITYELEDTQDFEQKKTAMALDITVPATANNQKLINSFQDPSVEDLTPGSIYRNPRDCSIIAADVEVLNGKALLQAGTHTDLPEGYLLDCVGANGDWMLDLQDTTLFDCLPTATHTFTAANVIASWNNGGIGSTGRFVYAPVRYRKRFGANEDDLDVSLLDMRPSLFIYWMIRQAFDSIGYTISSAFFDLGYFRRFTLPWTWGDFLSINSPLADMLLFKAAGPVPVAGSTYTTQVQPHNGGGGGIFYPGSTGGMFDNFQLSNANPTFGFDNNGNYSYNASNGESIWTYKSVNGKNFGTITARFGVSTCGGIALATYGSNASIYIDVYRNGNLAFSHRQYDASAGGLSGPGSSGTSDMEDNRVYNFSVSGLNPGDTVSIKFRYTYFQSTVGNVSILFIASLLTALTPVTYRLTTFELFGITIEPGGLVDFKQYDVFKNYKFLDMLRGLVDYFDLIAQTDSVNKVVTFEPSYPYSAFTGSPNYDGYFSKNRLDWTFKQDLTEESKNNLYSESERELLYKHKGDSSNGGRNIHEKRYGVEAGASKYLLSQRFTKGKKELVNRFFAAPMHYNADQWKNITGISPQLMAFIPENVANTSAGESEQVFEPVLAVYEGWVQRNIWGGWSFEGWPAYDLPFMYAVCYKPGGENKPILTYSDQAIPTSGGSFILGKGLMSKFFLNRLAVIEYGKLYETWINLNNNDVTNWLHREAIVINGADYYLVKIDGYNPLLPVATKCTLWKYAQPTQANVNACFPSQISVLSNPATIGTDDIRYARLLLSTVDIP